MQADFSMNLDAAARAHLFEQLPDEYKMNPTQETADATLMMIKIEEIFKLSDFAQSLGCGMIQAQEFLSDAEDRGLSLYCGANNWKRIK